MAEQGQTAEIVTAKSPLIRFEKSNRKTLNRVTTVAIGIAGIGAIAFTAGMFSSTVLLTILGVILLMGAVIFWVLVRRNASDDVKVETAKKIKEETNNYENDLRETLYGYDIDCPNDEINAATAAYRKQLEDDAVSLFDADNDTVKDVFNEAKEELKNKTQSLVDKSSKRKTKKPTRNQQSRKAGFLAGGGDGEGE